MIIFNNAKILISELANFSLLQEQIKNGWGSCTTDTNCGDYD